MTPSKKINNENDQRVPPAIDPHRYDHLIPAANRLLRVTAKATWKMMKFLVAVSFRIPGLVKKHASKKPIHEQ